MAKKKRVFLFLFLG